MTRGQRAARAIQTRPALAFWTLAYAAAWGALATGIDALEYVAKFAFTASALVLAVVGVRHRELLASLRNWRVPLHWYAVALGAPLAAYGLAAIAAPGPLDVRTGKPLDLVQLLLIDRESGLLTYALLRGGMGEEPGLRGMALGLHEQRVSLLRASTELGILWGLWHLPVILAEGAGDAIVLVLAAIALSHAFTWLFNAAGRSVPVVILAHAAVNAGDDILESLCPSLRGTEWETLFAIAVFAVGLAAANAHARRHRLDPRPH